MISMREQGIGREKAGGGNEKEGVEGWFDTLRHFFSGFEEGVISVSPAEGLLTNKGLLIDDLVVSEIVYSAVTMKPLSFR